MKELRNNIARALEEVYPRQEAEGLARLALEFLFGMPYHRILMERMLLTPQKEAYLKRIVERLLQAEPIQYITGTEEFYGLRLRVNRATLIPRPETEELVALVLADCKGKDGLSVLDIGTGSGCIALSLAKHLPGSQVTGVDISTEALEVAKENARLLNVDNCSFQQMDILSNIFPATTFDCIVSNPPYVMEKEREAMEKNVLRYEPESALFVPDDDPLLFYRHIARLGKTLLRDGGRLYFEINAQCGQEMVDMMREEEYQDIELIRDLSDKDRFIKAIRR